MQRSIRIFLLFFLTASVFSGCFKGKDIPGTNGGKTNGKSINAPSDLYASNGTYKDKIVLDWSKVEGAEKYYLYRCSAPVDGNCDSNSLNFIRIKELPATQNYYEDKDTSLTADKLYCYKVSTWASGLGESLKSKSAKGKKVSSFGITVPNEWAEAGSGAVTASNGTYKDKIHLEWIKINEADGYEIYRCEALSGKCDDSSQHYEKIAEMLKDSTNQYIKNGKTYYFYDDTNVVKGKIYCYVIKPFKYNSSDPNSPKIYGEGSSPVQGKLADEFTQTKPDQGTISANDDSNPNFPVRPDSVRISWGKVNGAEKYYIYRATGEITAYYFEIKVVENLDQIPTTYNETGDVFFDSASNKYVFYDKNVVRGVTYWYKIKAWSLANGYSDETDPISGKLPEGIHLDTSVFPAPTGLNAADGSELSKIHLSWNNVSNAVSYLIQRNTSSAGLCGSNYTDLGGSSANSFDDTTAEEGVKYCYRVKAYDSSNNYSDFSTADSGYRKLSPPQAVSASKGTLESDVTVNGYAQPKASGYKIYRASYSGGCGVFNEIATASGTEYNDTSAIAGNKYCYKVQALSQYTGNSDLSEAFDSGFKKLPYPASISATDGLLTVTITWSNITGASSYKVYRSDDSYNTVRCSAADGLTGCQDSSVVPGTQYTYKIKAYTSAYDSNQYSEFSIVSDTGYKQLSAPSSLQVIEANSSLKLTWAAPSGEDISGYEVWRAPENFSGTAGDYELLTQTTGSTYSDESAPWGETFYYQIKAYNTSSGALSAFSSSAYAKREAVNEGEYKTLGSAGFSSAAGRYTSIEFHQGIAYVAYNQPSDDKIYVKKYNKGNSTWEDLGIAGTGAHDYAMTKIAVKSGSEIFVAYAKSDHSIAVKKGILSNGNWTWTDLSFSGQGYNYLGYHYSFLTMALSSSGIPFVAFRDTSQNIIVKSYSGSWQDLGTSGLTKGYSQVGGSYLAIYVKGETPYIAYIETSTHNLVCKKLASTTWQAVGNTIDADPDYEDSNSYIGKYTGAYTNLFVASDTEVYVSYKQRTDTFIHVKKLNGSNWDSLGGTSEKGSRHSIKLIKNVVYLGYQAPSDSNKAKIIKYYNGAEGLKWYKVGGKGGDGVLGSLPSETDSYVSLDFYNGSVYAAYTDKDQGGKVTVKY